MASIPPELYIAAVLTAIVLALTAYTVTQENIAIFTTTVPITYTTTYTVTAPPTIYTITHTQVITHTETKVYTVTQTITPQPTVKTVRIGALIPLTGGLATYGVGMRDAVRLAVEDANAQCPSVRFEVLEEDTATNPTKALERLQALYGRGVRIVVGPMSSREVSAIKGFADGNKILVFSPSSTSPALALKDWIFRMVPTDEEQAKAIVALLKELGVKRALIVYRKDPWGVWLNGTIREEAARAGISVVASEAYDPAPAALPTSVPVAISRLSAALREPAPDVALVFVSFEDDGILAVRQAAADPVLSRVRWVGTDGMAESKLLVEEAGDMLARMGFMATVAAPDPGDPAYRKFVDRYRARYGRDPVPYDPYAYDTFMMLAQIICQLGTDDPEKARAELERWGREGRYTGVTGRVFLNEAGDRAYPNYLITGIKIVDGKPTWTDVAFYYGETGKVKIMDYGFFYTYFLRLVVPHAQLTARAGEAVQIPVYILFNLPGRTWIFVGIGEGDRWIAEFTGIYEGFGIAPAALRMTAPPKPGSYIYEIQTFYLNNTSNEWIFSDSIRFELIVK